MSNSTWDYPYTEELTLEVLEEGGVKGYRGGGFREVKKLQETAERISKILGGSAGIETRRLQLHSDLGVLEADRVFSRRFGQMRSILQTSRTAPRMVRISRAAFDRLFSSRVEVDGALTFARRTKQLVDRGPLVAMSATWPDPAAATTAFEERRNLWKPVLTVMAEAVESVLKDPTKSPRRATQKRLAYELIQSLEPFDGILKDLYATAPMPLEDLIEANDYTDFVMEQTAKLDHDEDLMVACEAIQAAVHIRHAGLAELDLASVADDAFGALAYEWGATYCGEPHLFEDAVARYANDLQLPGPDPYHALQLGFENDINTVNDFLKDYLDPELVRGVDGEPFGLVPVPGTAKGVGVSLP